MFANNLDSMQLGTCSGYVHEIFSQMFTSPPLYYTKVSQVL